MDATTPTAPAPTAPSAPPPSDPAKMSLRSYRESGATTIDAPVAAKTEAPDVDPDVDADPELAGEIDSIEKAKPEETPAEKAARTRRHKEAAIKSRITKLARARDGEKERADRLERELADARRGAGSPPQPAATAPAKAEAPEPTRAKPTLKDFPIEKFADEDDPYAAQQAAHTEALYDWKQEQNDHAARVSRQRAQADERNRAIAKALDDSEAEAKAEYADYDAVVGAARFPQTPASPYVLDSIAESGIAGPLAYHLARPENRDRMLAILNATSRRAVDLALGAEIATVKAARAGKTQPAAPPKVTSAAEPIQPVTAAAGTGASTVDPFKAPGTKTSVRQLREWEKQHGRRS